jgi:CxxC motif-containing protein (DUF1111 family)
MTRNLVALLSFLLPLAALAGERPSLDAEIGARLFKRVWVPGVSSTISNDGLGPLFNARSCAACHQGLKRSVFPAEGGPLPVSAVIRLSKTWGGSAPHPQFGKQIQTMGVPGVAPEAVPVIHPVEKDHLRQWQIDMELPVSTPAISLRAAPDLSMSGLIEAVDSHAITKAADPDDHDGDGISGRVHTGEDGRIGRFGWKAAHADLMAQTRAAFSTDLGLSTEQIPHAAGDCTMAQEACLAAPGAQSKDQEIPPLVVGMIVTYLARVTMPERPDNPEGTQIFTKTGCAACHSPALPDSQGKPLPLFSDLLLHDMGESLTDGASEGSATASEWRTTPLIRLADGEKSGLLHDGRARSIEEAILWHGGEARHAQMRFKALPVRDRQALIAYLKGL